MPSDSTADLRLQRERIDAAPRPGRRDSASAMSSFLGQVVNGGSMGTSPLRYYLANPVTPSGAEVEGGTPGLAADAGAKIPFVWLGPGTPAVGARYAIVFARERWVAWSGGVSAGTGPTIPGCSCTDTPARIAMTSAAPSCQGGMFQSDTLTWGPTPAGYAALGLGDNSYLSDHSWVDANGDSFRYYLNCSLTNFTLGRVYLTSVFGSPFLDSVRYSWSLAAAGNTCVPFSLTNGQIFTGGDPTCSVSLADAGA